MHKELSVTESRDTKNQKSAPSRRESIAKQRSGSQTETQDVAIPITMRRISSVGRNDPLLASKTSSENGDKPILGILGTILVDDAPESKDLLNESLKNSKDLLVLKDPIIQAPKAPKIEKREASRIFQKYATFNKGSTHTPAPDEDSDKESVASNESYDPKKNSRTILNIPLSSFAGELRKKKSERESVEKIGVGINISIPAIDSPIVITPSKPTEAKLLIPTTQNTSLIVPGSDIVHVRRASFSGTLLKQPTGTGALPSLAVPKDSKKPTLQPSHIVDVAAVPTLAIPREEKPRRKSVVFSGEDQVKVLPEVLTPIPGSPSESTDSRKSKVETLQIPGAQEGETAAEQTVNAWKKLKRESKSNLFSDQSAGPSKFTNISEIVHVMKDLKTLGMQSSLVVCFLVIILIFSMKSVSL